MNRKSIAPIPEPIAQLQRQLDQFRSANPPRTKLPEPIWVSATDLAKSHGIWSVEKSLRLDYMGLKNRLIGSTPPRRKPLKPAFVELLSSHPPASPAECLIEFESGERGLTPEQRLQFHRERSGPAMEQLHGWLEAQFAERKTVPNSGLGKAITCLLRHWRPLRLFLRVAGAPLDNNIAERALKRAVLRRKNALFYRTMNGAQVGGRFMSLIHTCQLCGANSFDDPTELQRHARELAANPAESMPWNYRPTLNHAEV